MDAILFWNQVSLDANKADFSPEKAEDKPQQGGPTRTSRALAIVHLAMYDAYVGITGGATPPTYLTYTAGPGTASLDAAKAAVAAAACVTLIELYSRQRETFLRKHQEFVSTLTAGDPDVERGLVWGRLVAELMLQSRKGDGSDASDDHYAPSSEPGKHRVDPQNPGQGFLGPLWGKVKPFGIANLTSAIPLVDPPPLNSAPYASDYNQVKSMGVLSGGTRSAAQTTRGMFWAYDGARGIGVPPRLYNQAVREIAANRMTTEPRNARLFAMVNVAMADAGIFAWFEKYHYNFWRPVAGIREADADWGPTGAGDGNGATAGDPYWQPLGSPRTNQPGVVSFTPNFPAYPSGHATFGTAALKLVELELELPAGFTFKFVSDELDGKSIDRDGSVRTRYNNSMSIDDAITHNLLSRVYLGVHWKFDGDEGKRVGLEIAIKINAKFPVMA